MKRILALALLICLLLSIPYPGYCTNKIPWGQGDIHPQLGRQLPYDWLYLGQSRDGVSVGVSTMVSDLTAVPLGYGVIRKYIGATVGQAGTLADGVPGQILTIVIYTRDPSGTFILTPSRKSGFASLTFDAVGDSVTLLYTGENYGWMLMGVNSVTVNQ